MICPTCGKELPESAKFCGGCGSPMAEGESAGETAQNEECKPCDLAGEGGGAGVASLMLTASDDAGQEAPASAKEKQPRAVEALKGFAAAGSGANPFASTLERLNDRLAQMNEAASAQPFEGQYAPVEEADDVAAKARKAAEERAAARAAKKERAESRRGKKPAIAGFEAEEEGLQKDERPFAVELPSWDLLPPDSFVIDRSAR